jgi:hypothetical protein
MDTPTLKSNVNTQTPIRILLIGKSSIELNDWYDKLSKYTDIQFITDIADNIKEGLLKAFSIQPSMILLDDNLDDQEINEFTDSLDLDEQLGETSIGILKSSNQRKVMNSRVQDFIWKEELTTDSLAKTIMNNLKFRKTQALFFNTYRKGKRKVQGIFK